MSRGSAAVKRPLPGAGCDFWHGPVLLDSLCLYRAGFGLLLCGEAVTWLPHTTELFSADGFHLGILARFAPPPPVAFLLCLLLVLAAAAVGIGWHTRAALATTLGLWSFLYGIDQINEKAIHSVAIVVVTILLFSACAARYSLDDWLRRRRGLPRCPDHACAFPLRLLQLEFAQVYFFAWISKIASPGWVDGTVLTRALASGWATSLGVWVSGWLPGLAAGLGGLLVITYEVLAPFLLFVPRARPWVLGAGVIFHGGIQATLSVEFFGLHFLLALLLLYPDPAVIADLVGRGHVSRWAGPLAGRTSPTAPGRW